MSTTKNCLSHPWPTNSPFSPGNSAFLSRYKLILLKRKISRKKSQANSHRAPMAALHPKDVSMRSTNMKSHHRWEALRLGLGEYSHQSCLQRSQPTSTNPLPPAAWHGKPSMWCQRSPPFRWWWWARRGRWGAGEQENRGDGGSLVHCQVEAHQAEDQERCCQHHRCIIFDLR